MSTNAATAADRLVSADAAYRAAWEARELESALETLRSSLPGLEHAVATRKARIGNLEQHLSQLQARRDAFVRELARLPENAALAHLSGLEERRIRARRHDLSVALDAIDGLEDPRGTLADDLWNQPRISGTQRRIVEERERLAEAERELRNAKAQLTGA